MNHLHDLRSNADIRSLSPTQGEGGAVLRGFWTSSMTRLTSVGCDISTVTQQNKLTLTFLVRDQA